MFGLLGNQIRIKMVGEHAAAVQVGFMISLWETHLKKSRFLKVTLKTSILVMPEKFTLANIESHLGESLTFWSFDNLSEFWFCLGFFLLSQDQFWIFYIFVYWLGRSKIYYERHHYPAEILEILMFPLWEIPFRKSHL